MADTRKDKRAPVSLKVRFKSATVDEFIEHYSKDVSRGGIYIKSSQPMPVGTLLKFQFQLKDESALIRGVGRVVWTRVEEDAEADHPAGMGIKFIKMDNESRAMVERIIDSHADERGTYESGRYNATSAEPSSSPPPSTVAGEGGGSFFPDLPPAELPLPEDRTAVRQATEFIAAAISEGGTDQAAAKEAQVKAEEARKRTEEVEAQRREEADAKKKQEAEARASLRPKAPESASTSASDADAESDSETAPTPRSLPSMIIDPSLEPRAGRPSEQTPGSDVTPLPRPNAAVLDANAKHALDAGAAHEPDTEPPPPEPGELRSPTTSIPQVEAPARRSYLPLAILAAVLLVALIVFFRGGPEPSSSDTLNNDTPAGQQAASEAVAPATPEALPAPTPGAEPTPTPEVVEPSEPTELADARVAAPREELAPQAGVELVAVDVTATPRGTEIWLGETKQGPAPITLKLPSGVPVQVRASAPGHSEASEEVTPGKKKKLAFKLKQLPHTVRVESTPAGAAITVGAYKGVTPIDIAFDPPPTGQLGVLAKLDGYQPSRTQLKLDAFTESDGAMRAQLNLTLQPSLPASTGKEAASTESPKEKPKKPVAPAAPKKAEPKVPTAETPAAPSASSADEPKALEEKPVAPKAKPTAPKADAPKAAEPLPDNPFGE